MSGDGKGPASVGEALARAPGLRACTRPRRGVQVVRTGKRKLFDGQAKKLFLEWFAVTANTRFSAERADVTVKTVWRHRMKDPAFREAMDAALDASYARIEAKIIETVVEAKPIEIDGEIDVPDVEIHDPDFFRLMLKDHDARIEREAGLRGRRPLGPKLKRASEAEVLDALVKRLQVFGVRVRDEEGDPSSEA